jgi:cupin 2 domain-containing protein
MQRRSRLPSGTSVLPTETSPRKSRSASGTYDSRRLFMQCENLFAAIPPKLAAELFTTLHRAEGLRIERIVSEGHRSPERFWYDQNEHEWVVVLKGQAAIQFDDQPQPVELVPGSYLSIPAHRKHRVAWTSPTEQTVWLAVYSS